jgi:ribosomal protein S12 methylthiotransferase
MIPNHIDVITMGCSKNLIDSELLMKQLLVNGYTVAHDPQKVQGEIVIVNSCGFIDAAKEETIEMLLQLAEAKKNRQIKILLLMGCLSQTHGKELKQEIPEIDRHYGKFDWKQLLADLGKPYQNLYDHQRFLTTSPHYAYLKISEGCNRACSYCAIPLMTGKHISRSIDSIAAEVEVLVKQGVKEFQVIAQDLSYYGIDLYRKPSLAKLTETLANIEGVKWLRLHYAYPARFPLDILPVMKKYSNVCKYLDIALQHISDNMLTLMRRNISKKQTIDLIKTIRHEVPGIHLRTTLMTGHPGETADDFAQLVDFVEETQFERMGAFAYSHQEGTFAYSHYKDDISASIKCKRLEKLMKIQEKISKNVNKSKKDCNFEVVIDNELPDFYIGRTQFDSPEVDPEVFIEKDKRLRIGNFYNAQITDADAFELFAKVL